MAARVIHYGVDDCHRLTVLRGLGYSVDDCSSLAQLRAAFSANRQADAVCITETEGNSPEAAVFLAKSASQAPLVLFRRSNGLCSEEKFDLVVDTLTSPQQWVNAVETLVLRHQALRSRAQWQGAQPAAS
jgi:hypothetical protein